MPVNIERIRQHIETLAGFTTTPGAGSTRLSYSAEYRQACDYVGGHGRTLGLDVRYDAIGNLRMRLPGRDPQAPAVIIGSHLDTVIHGGDFDGILGVVAGLETVATLLEQGVQPQHPVEVINFVEEEGTTFRCPLTGSKAITGFLTLDQIKALHDDRGQTLYDAARSFGVDPDQLGSDQLQPDAVKAMLELHIEQGAVLESERVPVGIVEHIAGSESHRVQLQGRANHAGTTPMGLRYDALAGAAEMILAIERIAAEPERPDTVATVGRIQCIPNAANVIPGRTEFSIDVRDIDAGRIEAAASSIIGTIRAIAERRGLGWETELTGKSSPQPLARNLIDQLTELAEQLAIPYRRMPSGALHDAAMMTRVTDVAMIFVPSIDGRSHTPRERTHYTDIEHGANLLLAAVASLAGA